MANSKILIIHPVDETTDFLRPITYHLQDVSEADIELFRPSDPDDHAKVLDVIKKNDPSIPILFMGHGMSNALSGAATGLYPNGNFISEHELSVFEGKKVILLSCRSEEYLKKYGREARIAAGIGFPNLITESYEILYPEDNAERVDGITEADIARFRQFLVNLVKFSLHDFLTMDLALHQLYTRLKIRTQKALIAFYRNESKVIAPYGKMLYDLNEGLYYVN